MYTKLEITGKIEVLTGMHIGGSAPFSAIGAIDSPVIRDLESDLPIIPGSSLKGKLRYLLARKYNKSLECKNHDDDDDAILKLFGSSKKGNIQKSRLIFSDMTLSNMEYFKEIGIHNATEIKIENTINRLTAVANPRQIERVIRGSVFDLSIIYNVDDENDIECDIDLLSQSLKLLKYDYLGGNGSRGYGKVNITELNIKEMTGNLVNSDIIEECRKILGEV